MQFATRQGRLEDVGGIYRAFRRASPDQGMQFVNEQDRVAVFDLGDDFFQPLLELAAIFGARDERPDVQLQDALANQRLRHFAGDDTLGQAFNDGRLANTRFADQGGIVLAAPRQDLDHALDFFLAPDHRIEFAGGGSGSQVGAQCVHIGCFTGTGWFAGGAILLAAGVQHRDDLGANFLQRHAEAFQHAGSDAFAFTDQTQQQVFGADIVVIKATSLIYREFNNFFGAGGQPNLPHHDAVAPPDDKLDGATNFGQFDTEIREYPRGDPFLLPHQPQQDMLGTNVVMVKALCFFLRQGQNFAGTLRKLVEITFGHSLSPIGSGFGGARPDSGCGRTGSYRL